MIKKIICIIVTMTVLVMPVDMYAQDEIVKRFVDVPEGHWSEAAVHQLRDLGITKGVSVSENRFGLGDEITRAEFVTFLVRLKKWELKVPDKASFLDVKDSEWFYKSIETAVLNNVFNDIVSEFRPQDSITREEMAIMIINTLGYDSLAKLLNDDPSSFTDVNENVGYIELLKSFGIVNGKGDGIFAPKETAKREEAAAILIRMHNKINADIVSRNAFYADSSYSQMTKMQHFDSVSFGWAKLSYDEIKSEFVLQDNKPLGYEEPLNYAIEKSLESRLSILTSDYTKITDDNIGIITYLLDSDELQEKLIGDIASALSGEIVYDGVVIDFEDMASRDLREGYNEFLSKLDAALEKLDKSLTVMVQPSLYYKGYDFKTIGEVADQIIIMAHDYNARSLKDEEQKSGYTFTPLAPIQQVYETLVALTDSQTGVMDRTKISFQISMAAVQWGINPDGSVYNASAYQPSYEMINNRLVNDTTTISFNETIQSPKAEYFNTNDSLDYVIWYEDSRSVESKIKLAKMFDIEQISVWRLGNIPDYIDDKDKPVYMDVLETIIE